MLAKIETSFQEESAWRLGSTARSRSVTGATQGVGRAIAEALAAVRRRRPAAHRPRRRRAATPSPQQLADAGAPARLRRGRPRRPRRARPARRRLPRPLRPHRRCWSTPPASPTAPPSLDATLDDWATLFDVNARAPFFLMQAAIQAMRAQRRRAARSSTSCRSTPTAARPTSRSIPPRKAALALLTRNAANAHRFDRIRVNGINMGWRRHAGRARSMQAETLGNGPGWIEAANAAQPFGRLLAPQEVANLARLPAQRRRRPDDRRARSTRSSGSSGRTDDGTLGRAERLGPALLDRLPAGGAPARATTARALASAWRTSASAPSTAATRPNTPTTCSHARFDRWGVVGINIREPRARRHARPAGRPLHAAAPRRTTASRRGSIGSLVRGRRQPGQRRSRRSTVLAVARRSTSSR